MLTETLRERNHAPVISRRGRPSTHSLVYNTKIQLPNHLFSGAREQTRRTARAIGRLSNLYFVQQTSGDCNLANYVFPDAVVMFRSSATEAFIKEAYSTPVANAAYFEASVQKWFDDISFDSLPDVMKEYSSFAQIVAGGKSVIPLISAHLRRRPSFLFLALEEITGENPVPEHAFGDLNATVDAWLQWIRS